MRPEQLKVAQKFGEAQRAIAAGQPRVAIKIAQPLYRENPRHPGVNALLGNALMMVGHGVLARKHFKTALEGMPREGRLMAQMGITHTMEGNFAEARKWFDRALALLPGDAEIIGAAAEASVLAGEHARALEEIRPLLERAEGPTPGVAMLYARIGPKVGKGEEALAMLRRLVGSEGLLPLQKMTMLFRLGDMLDARGEYDAAFEAYREGNEMRKARGAYIPESYERLVDTIIGRWTKEAMARLPRSSNRSERPVFIVGMPRSGTSLVEQIIASHPKAYGAGELEDIGFLAGSIQQSHRSGMQPLVEVERLTKPVVEQASRDYFEALRSRDANATRVTDKMPVNFQHLGLIECLTPGARVIHCVRNAMDTCLSCYFQLFTGHNMFSYGLADVGHFYQQYLRQMEHWRGVVGLPILEVVYEDLVADQEAGTRRILEFVGLEWDDACLRFHESSRVVMTASNEQVRRPMYRSSVERWRRYEKHLGPLKEALGVA